MDRNASAVPGIRSNRGSNRGRGRLAVVLTRCLGGLGAPTAPGTGRRSIVLKPAVATLFALSSRAFLRAIAARSASRSRDGILAFSASRSELVHLTFCAPRRFRRRLSSASSSWSALRRQQRWSGYCADNPQPAKADQMLVNRSMRAT